MKSFILVTILFIAVCFPASSQAQRYMAFVRSTDSLFITYETHGDGAPALVFVHGWLCNRSYWKEQLKPLSQRFKVVALDLPRHTGRRSWTIETFADDVAVVVKKLDLKRVILIGHSMGGDVIAEAARRLPGRIAGLIMVDSYKNLGPGRSPAEVEGFLARLRSNFADNTRMFVRSMFIPGTDSTLVEFVSRDMSSAPPAIALAIAEAALNYSRKIPQTLQELKLPVIAINADNSPTDTVSMKRYGVETLIMPGTGHFLFMEKPGEFNRFLEMAINKIVP